MTYREKRTILPRADIAIPVFEPETNGRPRQVRREAAAARRRTRFYEALAAAVCEETERRCGGGTRWRCKTSFTVRETGRGTAVEVTVTFFTRGAKPVSRTLRQLWRDDVLLPRLERLSKNRAQDTHSS